jgi:hypothetical protein
VLVLLMGVIHEVRLRWHDTYTHTRFHEDWYRSSNNIQTLSQKRLQCWYYYWKGLMNYAVKMDSGALIYIPSFIKTDSPIQKLIGGDTHKGAQAYFYFFKITKVG